ncbi:MAG: T9SS type A sorting domain-containing protein [Candidatus Cloacimonadota bacterium]|nr:MAG: T9SS type A sorting domain-containing protein [Candidatus Cloacimonadota bacterium]
MKNIVIIMFTIIIVPLSVLNGTILSRSTFEEWEGISNWNISTGSNGDIRVAVEDPDNNYQTQSHGAWSLRIQDLDDNSYANASKIFTNSSSEYMIEFYLWIYYTHSPIDEFILCELWNIPDEGLAYKTDIALVLDTVGMIPNHHPFEINIEDANGIHFGSYIDSTDMWYKIQIHRHPDPPLPAVVDFYVDGELKGTFVPMNSNYVSNKISLGTTEETPGSDGEVFYDDVIITTPPEGEHPRLLFDEEYVDTVLIPRKTKDLTTCNIKYSELWFLIEDQNDFIRRYDSITVLYNSKTDTIKSYHPFPQPNGHSDNTTRELWLSFSRKLERRLNIFPFYYLLEQDSISVRERAREILLSLCNDWRQWTDPDFHNPRSKWSLLDTGFFLWSAAITYDILYDYLSTYERMTVQNSIITLGLNQTYLRALHATNSQEPWKWPNGNFIIMSGMGIGSLVTDDAFVETFLDTARAKVEQIVKTNWVCDPAGGLSEGLSYSSFSMPYLLLFMQADTVLENSLRNENYLKNYARWRLYSMLPVWADTNFDSTFIPDSLSYSAEVNFSDYGWGAVYVTFEMYRLASFYHDSLAQWYINKRPSHRMYPEGQEYIQLFYPYLWFDNLLDTLNPNSLPKAYLCPQIGWGIFRTGWNLNDFIFAFKGDTLEEYLSHRHRDRNSFIFGMNGRWFLEDWGYAKVYNPRTGGSADYHNVIIADNDTSQVKDTRGKIEKFYYSPDFGYIYGDASDCVKNLERWSREVLFLNEGGYFVIKDFVEDTNSTVDTLRWQVNSYILQDDSDTLWIIDSLRIAHIRKNNKYLKIEIHKPNTIDINTTAPYSNRPSYKRIYGEFIDPNGIDSLVFLASFIPYDGHPDSCPEVAELNGGTMRGVFIDTDERDNALLFSQWDNVVKSTSYVINVPSGGSVLNVLADLYVSAEQEFTPYTVVDENLAAGVRTDFTVLATPQGTASFEITDAGNHRLTVFIPDVLVSNSEGATMSNSNQKFVYNDRFRKFYLLYEDDGKIMHSIRFKGIDGWVEGYSIGEGRFPALSSYKDMIVERFLGAVWVNDYKINFARYTDVAGWSELHSLIEHIGVKIEYSPPSLIIDDVGIGYLAWEMITEPLNYPGEVTYELHYSTFDAKAKEPSIIEDVILDEATEYVTHPTTPEYVSASLDLDDNNIPVVSWSRAIGDGKNTVYCKQRLGGVWPEAPDVVSSPDEVSISPFCCVKNDIIHVVWEDEGIIRHRQRGLATDWMAIETVSNPLNASRNPQLLDGNICIYTEGSPLQAISNVVYSMRVGTIWLPSQIIESTPEFSEYPQGYIEKIPSFDRTLYTVWTDGNEPAYEIRYKQVEELPFTFSGYITENTVWDMETIYITGDVVISGATLTISSGVRVMIVPLYDDRKIGIDDDRIEIIVADGGRFLVEATETDSVYFISARTEGEMRDWFGIRFTSSDTSALNYVNLRHGKNAITCETNSAPILQNVSISNNEMGIKAMQASLTIKKSSIFDNYTGIHCISCSGVVIDSCDISNNPPSQLLAKGEEGGVLPLGEPEDTVLTSGTGIYLNNCGEISVTNNRIVNDYKGVYAKGFVNGVFENNYVESNEWHGFDIAVTRGSQMQFLNNTFISNAKYPINHGLHKRYYREFAGLSLGVPGVHTGETDILVKGNTFEDNTCGTRFSKYYAMTSPGIYNVRYEDNVLKDNFYGFALSAPKGISGYTGTFVFNTAEMNDSAGVFSWFGVDSGAVNLGNLSDADTTNDGANHIRWNGTWEVMNVCPFLTYGHGNLWSSSIAESIDALILDNEEDPSNGMLDFSGHYISGIIGDTTWSGIISLCGDIWIPDSVCLTILEGTEIRAAAGMDFRNLGVSENLIEVIVEGNIEIKPKRGLSKGELPGSISSISFIGLIGSKDLWQERSNLKGSKVEKLKSSKGTIDGQPVHFPIVFTSDAYEPSVADWYGIELGGLNWEGKGGRSSETCFAQIDADRATRGLVALQNAEQALLLQKHTPSLRDTPLFRGDYTPSLRDTPQREVREIHYFEIEYAERGLVLCEGENLSMKDCTFRSNEAGLKLTRNSDITVKDCVFKNNTTYGIYIGDGVTGTLKNDTVSSNSTGIIFNGDASCDVKGCVIEGNETGVYLSGTSHPSIKDSKIINNSEYGIYITNSASPNLGGKGHNYIFGNWLFNAYNNTSIDIFAKNNYWGSTNIDSVEKWNWDRLDDPALGKIYVKPLWSGDKGIGGAMSSGQENKFIFSLKISPNPFTSVVSVQCQVPSDKAEIELSIYDISGRKVRTLLAQVMDRGIYSLTWNGDDDNDKKLSSGIYFLKAIFGDKSFSKKLIMIKNRN